MKFYTKLENEKTYADSITNHAEGYASVAEAIEDSRRNFDSDEEFEIFDNKFVSHGFYKVTKSGVEKISKPTKIKESHTVFGSKIHEEVTSTNHEGFIVNDICLPETFSNKKVRVIVFLEDDSNG